MQFTTRSEAETIEAGQALLPRVAGGGVLALVGDLGAGKTQFVKGLARAAGFEGPVTSPTFGLVHEYPPTATGPAICHFDLYRLDSEAELWDLGWEEFLDRESTVLAVEWADRFPEAFPPETLWIDFERTADEGERLIQLREAPGP